MQVNIYIYTYIYMCVCVCVYIYIYIYMQVNIEALRTGLGEGYLSDFSPPQTTPFQGPCLWIKGGKSRYKSIKENLVQLSYESSVDNF